VVTLQSRDPGQPLFWSERFAQRITPWDRGGVPAELRAWVGQDPRPRAVLIPGCGSAYEVAYLAQAGWDVTAIDFSAGAVAAARQVLGPWAAHVVEADFFHFTPPRPPELIYECAFFCALPPRLRPDVVARWAELLPPGGLLAGFFFFDQTPKGPPFGIGAAELEQLLAPFFERLDDRPVADSLPVFAGRERWQVWRRR